MQQQGVSLSEISRRLGGCRTTVRRYLRTGPAALVRGEPPRSLLPRLHVAYFHDRWAVGYRQADDLYTELSHDHAGGDCPQINRPVTCHPVCSMQDRVRTLRLSPDQPPGDAPSAPGPHAPSPCPKRQVLIRGEHNARQVGYPCVQWEGEVVGRRRGEDRW